MLRKRMRQRDALAGNVVFCIFVDVQQQKSINLSDQKGVEL